MNFVILNRLTPPLRPQFSSSPVLVSVIIIVIVIVIVYVINILIVIIIIITITIIMGTIMTMLYDNIINVQVY